MCKSNLFKHFLKAIKVVELTTDSGNKFQTEIIRLQKLGLGSIRVLYNTHYI